MTSVNLYNTSFDKGISMDNTIFTMLWVWKMKGIFQKERNILLAYNPNRNRWYKVNKNEIIEDFKEDWTKYNIGKWMCVSIRGKDLSKHRKSFMKFLL